MSCPLMTIVKMADNRGVPQALQDEGIDVETPKSLIDSHVMAKHMYILSRLKGEGLTFT